MYLYGAIYLTNILRNFISSISVTETSRLLSQPIYEQFTNLQRTRICSVGAIQDYKYRTIYYLYKYTIHKLVIIQLSYVGILLNVMKSKGKKCHSYRFAYITRQRERAHEEKRGQQWKTCNLRHFLFYLASESEVRVDLYCTSAGEILTN